MRVLRAGSLRSHRSFIPGGGPAPPCSDVLALRAADYGTRGSGASCVYGLAGAGRVVAALGEHRCARSRAFAWRVRRCARSRTWGACGAPLRPRFGLICLEPISVHPPLLRKTCTRASRIAVFRPDFDARVHVLGEALCGFESLARCRKKPEPGDRHGLRASMAERGVRGAASRRRPLRPLARSCVLRWKTLRVSSVPHLHRVRIPHPLQKKARIPKERRLGIHHGGERGIRTLEALTRPTVFKTAAFNRSAISPW